MRRLRFHVLFVCACLGLLAVSGMASAQSIPRAGRNFSFGIIEGAEQLAPSGSSNIFLTILSAYSGTGTITSAVGYSATFSFTPNVATIIPLPDSLAHIADLGLTRKAISVSTTQPINLVLHDFISEAGEATQLYPNEALDNNYVVTEWGLWNDPSDGENNRDEFLITAADNEETVTITPSVRTMLGQPAGVPFKISMNKGDCYMVKADTSAGSFGTSTLAGSVISSVGYVSVIVGTTCAYVPLAVQSCNELMDELAGRRWWGKQFFVQPLGNEDSTVELLLSSDTTFFATVTTSDGNTSMFTSHPATKKSTTAYYELGGAAQIVTSAPVQVHQLTRGSSEAAAGLSDPSIVTILPVTMYADTFFWNTPHLVESDLSNFTHYTPIIYPTAQGGSILLDGVPLTAIPSAQLYAPAQAFAGTTMSAINPMVSEGVHRLISPVPVFALATGFAAADAYSFIPGGTAALASASVAARPMEATSLSAYPNPARNTLTVISKDAIDWLSLVDPLSRTVLHVAASNGSTTIDVTDIPSGSYLLRGSSMNESASIRVTIVH